ncbi:MAG: hypothetical protein U0002_08540 [Thermoanaerobaculia bacterium]
MRRSLVVGLALLFVGWFGQAALAAPPPSADPLALITGSVQAEPSLAEPRQSVDPELAAFIAALDPELLHSSEPVVIPSPVLKACTPSNWCSSCTGGLKYCERFSNCTTKCYSCVGC